MTRPTIQYRSYSPGHKGCTHRGCGTQDTVTVDGVHGRRCAEHPPPDGGSNPWSTAGPEGGAA